MKAVIQGLLHPTLIDGCKGVLISYHMDMIQTSNVTIYIILFEICDQKIEGLLLSLMTRSAAYLWKVRNRVCTLQY